MNRPKNSICRFFRFHECLLRNDGFSLIEVLVATAVSSVILLMIYSAHRTVMTATHELTRIASYYERLNLAVAMIDHDISCTFSNKNNKDICFIAENNTGPPWRGKLNFVSVNHRSFSISVDPSKEVRRSDIQEVGYFVKTSRDRPDYHMLMKREDITFDKEPEEGGTESIILENILDLKFEFKLRNTWVDSWDSRGTINFRKR